MTWSDSSRESQRRVLRGLALARDLIGAAVMQSTESSASVSFRDPDLAQPEASAIAATDYFVFRLRGRTYALRPSSIDLVSPMQPIVPVPTAGPHVRGVIHLRGRVIAVIDLASLLGIDDLASAHESARLIVVAGKTPFGFVADATLGIWAFADDAQTRTTDDGPIVCGRIEDRGGAATLIDVRAIIDRIVSLRAERP
jgi:purine-binding chemotaxis protein CheW